MIPLINDDCEDFIYHNVFKNGLFKSHYLKEFTHFRIKSLYEIRVEYVTDESSLKQVHELSSRIQKFYHLDLKNNMIDEIIDTLNDILNKSNNLDQKTHNDYLAKVKSNLYSIYRHNLLMLFVFEFLAYAYEKEKYTLISKLVNYRYLEFDYHSLSILLPNHFYDYMEQLESFLWLAFSYSGESFNIYHKLKPRYSYHFTIVYLCYCFVQNKYHLDGCDNCWTPSRICLNNIHRALLKTNVFNSHKLTPYFEAINQIQKGLEPNSLSKNPESEKAVELFKELTKYDNAFCNRASSSSDQKQFFKDELNKGLNQAKEFFEMVSEFKA